MKFVAIAALCMTGALLPGLSHAQIYMCKDAAGKTITSDKPIPECADRAVREYGKNGQYKRDIPPPMTAEERRKQEDEEARKKADEAAVKEKRRADNALLARYRSEADIDVARKRALATAQEQQKRESANLAKSEQQLAQAQAEVDGYNKNKAKPPVELTRSIDDLQIRVTETKKRVLSQNAEIAKINTNFDETLKRYKELAASGPAR